MDTLRMRSTDYRFSGMNPKFVHEVGSWRTFSIRFLYNVGNLPSFCMHRGSFRISAGLAETCITSSKEAILEDIAYKDTYPLKFMQKVEGKISVRVHKGNDNSNWNLTIGCNLQGKWILHWGVTYSDELVSGWDQPPADMRPPGSVLIKDYAVETPLRKLPSSVKGNVLHEIQIDISKARSIAALHFVLKEEETGAWYQHRGADFKVNFLDIFEDSGDTPDRKGFQIWPVLSKILSIVWGRKESLPKGQGEKITSRQEGICEEYLIVKETIIGSVLNISIQESQELEKRLVYFDTDLSGNVCVHWGVCKDDERRWEIPSGPRPPNTHIYNERALRTLLQTKEDGIGCQGVLALDKKLWGLLFVLKVDDSIWVNNMGNNFYVPLQSGCSLSTENKDSHLEDEGKLLHLMDSDETIVSDGGNQEASSHNDEAASETHLNAANVSDVQYRNEIISEIRNLVSDISSERSLHTKNKESQDSILQEISKLAAEAYSIFRSSRPIFSEESVSDDETTTTVTVSSGTGSGYEILLQGFNWESNKSGRWYLELSDKAAEIASLGFTVIWFPPPTESVSPEGYMPKDLYNLDSRYGSMEQLKNIVGRFHDVGVKVLGDVVLNHRCAHYQNKNGIWNVFGGQLAWDDRAIVSDDPHFQGRGNKSSGDNFHAAPNIDHSQEFVTNDIKEWLCWLRKEIGYDGWRLDYVRGFWGGYVKQYLNASEPYFSVGEYWDSLSYTYGSMDHNQDAHRQRIVDWINATNGAAGAFDVTTKGILHSALERCEYWRLRDERGNPPGVLGWWPSRAVTFIENHDTGSTQGHWRFPAGKEMQGYAYILTHPGTPTVFYDHVFSHLKEDIAALISLRNRAQIHCRSNIQINRAERDVYVATVNDKVVVKIGPGYHEPPSGENWVLSLQGKDYQIWEAL